MTVRRRPGPAAAAIRRVTEVTDAGVVGLATVLKDCVDGGASVGFMHPFTEETAMAFWRGVAGAVGRGESALLVAEDADGIAGTVQLVLDVPENQPHRADVAKMLVHRRARRQGLGGALMRAVEEVARDLGRSLLVLDTAAGSDAERLYARMGWQLSGVIPRYALWPEGGFCDTAVLYRDLPSAADGSAGTAGR